MPGIGVIAVAALLSGVAAFAPRRWAFGTLVAALLLIPAPLVVPNPGTPVPTVGRVVLVAAMVGLAWRLASGRTPFSVLRPTPVHLALALYAVVALVVGVGAAAPTTPVLASLLGWAGVAEQALVFVVALAWMRSLPSPWDAARILAGAAAFLAVLAVIEQTVGWGWGQWWFADLPSQQATDAARRLGRRAGETRIRTSSEFALEFGWVAVALLPLLLAVAADARRKLFLAAAGAAVLLALASYWSVTRSATAALGVVVLGFVVLAADRRVTTLAALGVIATIVTLVLVPSLLDPLTVDADLGAIQVRSQRLPEILGLAAERPWTGLGFSGLDPFGFPTTDSSYLLAYTELGVVGLSVLVGLLVVAVAQVARGLETTRDGRRLVTAALVGMLALLAGAWAYDAFSVLQSARLFWLLAALGTVAAEHVGAGATARPRWSSYRAAVPVGAVLGGLIVAAASTGPATTTYRFETLSPLDESALFDPVGFGEERISSTCTLLAIRFQREPGATVRCRDLHLGAGIGEVRLEGPSPDAVGMLADDVAERFGDRLDWFEMVLAEPVDSGMPTPWRTAPVWAGLVGLEVAILAPDVLRRRGERRRGAAPATA